MATAAPAATTMTANSRFRFEDNFWGPANKGLEVLMGRLKAGKHVTEEIMALLKERASIEEDYGKRLTKLAKTFTTREEGGSLRESLDVVRTELENSARTHLEVAGQIRNELEKPLNELFANQNSVRKTHSNIVERHLKSKSNQVAAVNKAKDRYERSCVEVNQLQSAKFGLPQKDLDKLKAKLDKAQAQSKQYDIDYLGGVERLGDIHKKWVEDYRTACKEFQKLEEERINFTRSTLWNYTNLLSSLCVSDDEAYERIRGSLEKCEVEKDMTLFVSTSSTGTDIPKPATYVNFYTKTSERPLNAGSTSISSQFASDALQSISEVRDSASAGGGGGMSNSTSTSSFGFGNFKMFGKSGSSSEKTGGGLFGGTSNNNNDGPVDVANNAKSSVAASAANGTELGADESEYFQYDPYDIDDNVATQFQVRALYDYKAQAAEELNILRGQVIPVIITHDDGWWEGVVTENGRKRKGLFPSNFVEKL